MNTACYVPPCYCKGTPEKFFIVTEKFFAVITINYLHTWGSYFNKNEIFATCVNHSHIIRDVAKNIKIISKEQYMKYMSLMS